MGRVYLKNKKKKNHLADLHLIVVSVIQIYPLDFIFFLCVLYLLYILVISGNNHMKEENYSAAVDCYTQAIELDPNNAVYYCNR